MALKKTDIAKSQNEPELSTLDEALDYFHEASCDEEKIEAAEAMVNFSDGPKKLVELLKEHQNDKVVVSHIAALLSKLNPSDAPIEEILGLLAVENAFVRNAAITTLQTYGEEIKYYIVKYLLGNDRDLRIFAVNVLGDVRFESSRDMLVELLEKEMDINVAMTAVDYMGEIGLIEDIPLLESLKSRFENEPYAHFAVDKAVASIKG